jgi:hypothetical protein
MARKNKGGRPARHKGEKLSKHRTFRVRDRLDEMLEEAAAKSGRSVSEQIERILEDYFFQARLNANFLGTELGDELLRVLRALMVVEGIAPGWDGDPVKAERFRTVANAVIAAFLKLPTVDLPPPEKRLEDMKTAKELLLRYSPRHVELPAEVLFSDLEEPDLGETPVEEPTRGKRRKAGT